MFVIRNKEDNTIWVGNRGRKVFKRKIDAINSFQMSGEGKFNSSSRYQLEQVELVPLSTYEAMKSLVQGFKEV